MPSKNRLDQLEAVILTFWKQGLDSRDIGHLIKQGEAFVCRIIHRAQNRNYAVRKRGAA